MSTPDNTGGGIIGIEPGDGNGGGTYPPPSPTPTPTPSPTPTPTPSPTPAPTPTGRASSLVAEMVRAVDSLIIPLAAAPAQEFAVALSEQQCRIALYSRGDGLYLDLLLDDKPVVRGVACLDRNPIVRAAYTGFAGELVFFDTQGVSDPVWGDLGSRYLLVWLGA